MHNVCKTLQDNIIHNFRKKSTKIFSFIKPLSNFIPNLRIIACAAHTKSSTSKKQFILPAEGDSARSLYGFTTTGTYLRVDPETADAFVSEEQAATTDFTTRAEIAVLLKRILENTSQL